MKRSRRDEIKEQTTDAPTVSKTKAVQRHCCQGDVVVKKSRRQEEVNGNCQGAQPGFYWPGNFKFVRREIAATLFYRRVHRRKKSTETPNSKRLTKMMKMTRMTRMKRCGGGTGRWK